MDLCYLDRCLNQKNISVALDLSDILIADLNKEQTEKEEIPENFLSEYVGGPALAFRLWAYYESQEDDNPIIIVPGNLCTSGLTGSDVLTIVFKSPQNRQMISHTFKSCFATRLVSCKLRAVVIKGRARRYSYLSIKENESEIILTEQFTHIGTGQIEAMFSKEDTSVICTGPACEASVPFSCVISEGKSTGRGGLGCVFESKNLRLVSVFSDTLKPENVRSEIDERIEKSKTCSEILKNGTSCFIKEASKKGWATVENYRFRTDPRLFHLYPSETERKTGFQSATTGIDEIMMLGPQCGCFEIKKISRRYKCCIELGLDPISAGNVLGSLGRNLKDDEEVFSILEGLAINGTPDFPDAYRINRLECGACDFRGSFSTALNASLGNCFPVYFDLHGMCSRKHHIWVAYNEDLVLGLESLGLDPRLIVHSLIDGIKRFRKLSAVLNPDGLKKLFANDSPAGTLPDFDSIIELGRKAWRLKTEINRYTKSDSPSLPDYFCVDPKSNYPSEDIVPLFRLLRDYSKLRNSTIVSQSPN